MKKEDIITLPNPHLRQKSEKIRTIDDDVKKLVNDMTNAALDWEDSRPHEISAALAAIQIDALKRIVIIRSDFENKEDREFTVLINPEIVKYEGEIQTDYEGCLSVRDIYGNVPRYTKIRVRALSIDGKEIRFKADGFLARVIQHEIDHTNGILFVDHIQDDKDAFYELDEKGELRKLDYEERIARSDLFDD
jgi:peptide deformylase